MDTDGNGPRDLKIALNRQSGPCCSFRGEPSIGQRTHLRWRTLVVRRSVPLFVLFALMCAARTSRAETTDHVRLRFGAGVGAGLVMVNYGSNLEPIATLPSATIRLGAQVNDRFAITYQIGGAILWTQMRNGILFEWTPSAWFTLGVGPEIDVIFNIPNGGGGSYGTFAVGGNARAALNIPIARQKSGHRYAISISADLTPAWATPLSGTLLPSGFQFGFMGGVGFELY